ncbi:MAG: molybdopterin-dependent oxidoreductase, partial [bacterium]|nr:molybdopterin-dependent oxidoreductase [bacterium]
MNRNTQNLPELDSLLRIDPEETITLFPGKVEIGQSIYTALAQIAAEELGVSLNRIKIIPADTDHSANPSSTTGSNSIQSEGNAIRQAAADARHILLDLAASHFQVPTDRLIVTDGIIKAQDQNEQITYWDLLGGRKFETQVTGIGVQKSPEHYAVVGGSATKLNLQALVTGEPVFVHDLEVPNMVHARVVHPPGYRAHLLSVEEHTVTNMPGVLQIVKNGSFLGVIAEREEQAVNAAEALRSNAQWENGPPLPSQSDLYDNLLRHPNQQAFLIVDGAPIDGPVPPIATSPDATQTLKATYYRPYHMHASLGPSAALAHLNEGRLTVWSHSQGIHSLRGALAQVLDLPQESLRVQHVEGSGCYGHNGADDAALDAALLARALPGRPVLLKWMREDEHAWEPYGSCMVVKMQGDLGAGGNVSAWNHDVWSYTHSGRPRPLEGASDLLSARHLNPAIPTPTRRPGKGSHSCIHRNADPLYTFS